MSHVACQRLAGKERPVGLVEAQPHWVLLLLSGLVHYLRLSESSEWEGANSRRTRAIYCAVTVLGWRRVEIWLGLDAFVLQTNTIRQHQPTSSTGNHQVLSRAGLLACLSHPSHYPPIHQAFERNVGVEHPCAACLVPTGRQAEWAVGLPLRTSTQLLVPAGLITAKSGHKLQVRD